MASKKQAAKKRTAKKRTVEGKTISAMWEYSLPGSTLEVGLRLRSVDDGEYWRVFWRAKDGAFVKIVREANGMVLDLGRQPRGFYIVGDASS